jgi:hypothetical protein
MPNSMADTVWSPYLSEAWELTLIRRVLFKVIFAFLVTQVPFHSSLIQDSWEPCQLKPLVIITGRTLFFMDHKEDLASPNPPATRKQSALTA